MTLFLDEELCVRWFTPAVSALFPLVPGDVGRRITDLAPLFEDPNFIRDALDTIRTDTVRSGEVRSAEGLWYSRRTLPFHGGSDPRKGVAVTFEDITARKDAEAALMSTEERLRRALETDTVGVLFFDKQGLLVDANEVFLRMSGWAREDIATGTLDWRRMTPPEYVPESEAQMEMLARTGRIGPYEKEYLKKDGSRAWMMLTGRDLGDGTMVKYAIDVTDRKLAERAMRDNEQRFRAFVMASADVVYRMNADWSEMWQLRGAGRFPDLPEPTANWLDVYIHPEDRLQVIEAARIAMQTHGIFDSQYRVRRIDGSFKQTHSRAVPILDERGQIVEWLGTVSDGCSGRE
jgi:two-component system CheB/CheR fusion protein